MRQRRYVMNLYAKVWRASADQRTGRCGRTPDGVCIRLYSQENYLTSIVMPLDELDYYDGSHATTGSP